MIQELYVSFEMAKLLKQKGFNIPVNCYYNKDGSSMKSDPSHNWNNGPFYSKPTLAMAMDWLRDKHCIKVIDMIDYDKV